MRAVLLDIAIYAVAITAIKMLIPDNSFKKQMDFIITCTFLLGISFLITDNNFDIDISGVFESREGVYIDYSGQLSRVQKREIESEITERLKLKLEERGIVPNEISIIINISDEGDISINEITLVLSEGVDANIAERLVKSEVGANVKVEIIER